MKFDDSILHIKNSSYEAKILTQGAQLVSFKLSNVEFFWYADFSTFKYGKAFRGGIPVCWPWFGGENSPNHGFARIVDWKLLDRIDSADTTLLRFNLTSSKKTMAIWPYKFELKLTIILSNKGVEVKLDVETSIKTTGALHTYLKIENIQSTTVKGLGSSYFDKLFNVTIQNVNSKRLSFSKEIDRIYLKPEAVTLLSNRNDLLKITHVNNSDIVVWNPWKKSKDFQDMNNEDYKVMVCIETARINKKFKHKDSLGCVIEKDVD